MKTITLSSAFLLVVSVLPGSVAMGKISQDTQQQPAADNTKTNKGSSPTADQQQMDPADREITKKIRKAIHQDNSLSVYAHNIKIITQGGKVTLKGPVHSEEEKTSIAAKAVAVAGDGNVTNQLDVVPPKQ
jgi:hyperosmotically inducible periplasmic protein